MASNIPTLAIMLADPKALVIESKHFGTSTPSNTAIMMVVKVEITANIKKIARINNDTSVILYLVTYTSANSPKSGHRGRETLIRMLTAMTSPIG